MFLTRKKNDTDVQSESRTMFFYMREIKMIVQSKATAVREFLAKFPAFFQSACSALASLVAELFAVIQQRNLLSS